MSRIDGFVIGLTYGPLLALFDSYYLLDEIIDWCFALFIWYV